MGVDDQAVTSTECEHGYTGDERFSCACDACEALYPSVSARTWHWYGEKSREELLFDIDRIITTDKPGLAKLYERLEALEAIARDAIKWTTSSAKDELEHRLEVALRDPERDW